MEKKKPLNRKSYGSIPHIPGSKTSSQNDIGLDKKGAAIFTVKTKQKSDHVIVTEKLDGSCCAVLKLNDDILSLGRAGYLAQTSPFQMHQIFADWVRKNEKSFSDVLDNGERFVGEWLAQAHGTRYDLAGRSPYVIFDLMVEDKRFLYKELLNRLAAANLTSVPILLEGSACSVEQALALLGNNGRYGAIDPAEGCVWRIERDNKCLTLAKWVRQEKTPGCYISTKDHPDVPEIWNWKPNQL